MPRRTTGSHPRPTPRRVRFSVPETDTSVIDWLGAQMDPSASLRAIIRDAIQRHGYADVTTLPVEQQPRRGRPPGSTSQRREEPETMPESDAQVNVSEPEVPAPGAPVSVPRVSTPVEPVVEATENPAETTSLSVNDMLGSLR